MSVVGLNLQGRFGNQLIQYLFAKAYAARHGAELVFVETPAANRRMPFIRDFLKDPEPLREGLKLPLRTDPDVVAVPGEWQPLEDGEVDVTLFGYWAYDKKMIYTREQARGWFRWRDDIADELATLPPAYEHVYHVRHGDYLITDFLVGVSRRSCQRAIEAAGYDPLSFACIEETTASCRPQLSHPDLAMVADFWRMTQAKVLFRSTSTYAWTAALLSHARVFSPVIIGKPSFKEVDCDFVEGNWPRMWCHPCPAMNTDLHVP